jgi:hypothetical protein
MGIFGQIILGLLIIAAGVMILKYNYQVANSIPMTFADRYMGGGGSYSIWKITAILIILIGFSVLFGIYDNILGWIVSPLTNVISPE